MAYNKLIPGFALFLVVGMLCLSGCGLFIINPLDPTGQKALDKYAENRNKILAKLEKYKRASCEEIRSDFGEPAQIRHPQLFRGVACEEVWEYEFPAKRATPFTRRDGFIWFCFEKGKVVLIDVM